MSTAAPLKLTPPAGGAKITLRDGKLVVPNNPIIPFIEGDGTGPDIWRASVRVMDAAVQKAYGGRRKIHWMEVFAGEKSNRQFNSWLPDETVTACRDFLVSIKGPLTTPVGGGIRSLNVALRQLLDLYVCLRPVRWFKGAAVDIDVVSSRTFLHGAAGGGRAPHASTKPAPGRPHGGEQRAHNPPGAMRRSGADM